jgi:hypothetical protein
MRPLLIAAGVVAFLAVAFGLARWLTTDNTERAKVERLLEAQARGDVRGMLRELDGCSGACAAQARANARRLRRAGKLLIVLYESETSRALGSSSGPSRIVWKTPQTLTVVQCVGVRRSGNALTGQEIDLVGIGAPRPRTAPC